MYIRFDKEIAKKLIGKGARDGMKEDFGKYKYLHFATHGLVSGDIKGLKNSTFVVLWNYADVDNGLLTASEIIEMDILSDTVLSACQTVSDFGSNATGIVTNSTFLNAGNKQIITSQ